MQSKLEQSQIEAINEKYHEHPLFRVCKKAFYCYDAGKNASHDGLEKLRFAPAEIMLESAIVLDQLLTDTDESSEYINLLWDSLTTKIRYWDKDATPRDLNLIVGAIHYVVAATLCHHIHSFYREQLRGKILDIIRQQMDIDEEEETRIICQLSLCAEGLNDWLQTYVESEDLLSEEILESSLRPNKAMKISRQKTTGIKSFATVVIKKDLVEAVITRLHKLMEGKTQPKDVLMPIRAAMDAGVIRRPTWNEFCSEFGLDCVKNKSRFSDYTNPDKTPYEGATYEALKSQFSGLLRD